VDKFSSFSNILSFVSTFFENILKIATLLFEWYVNNKRDLPWRNTEDPYCIWLSEILLQQTRVAQGLPYYLKFIEHFPTVKDLAAAREEDILNLWQGLGYYSRARNLHSTAHVIVKKYKGQFPSNYNDIRALKGIGDYTAAAISSFAFGLPHAVIDGNVNRVISRLFGIENPINKPAGQAEIKTALEQIFDRSRPALWNQAIMEFGALQCTPKNPNCIDCPLCAKCQAWSSKKVNILPRKEGKTKVMHVFHSYIVMMRGSKTYIHKREKGIWENLYQFPLVERQMTINEAIIHATEAYDIQGIVHFHSVIEIEHVLSHRKIFAKFYTISLNTISEILKNDIFETELDDLGKVFPTSVLTLKYLKQQK
jgi:A/G-specific adenine glycosylase